MKISFAIAALLLITSHSALALSEYRQKKQDDPLTMYYFVAHIDREGSPEHARLKDVMNATQNTLSLLYGERQSASIPTEYCLPPKVKTFSTRFEPDFLEHVIRTEYKNNPAYFAEHRIYKSIPGTVYFALQRQYPCRKISAVKPMDRGGDTLTKRMQEDYAAWEQRTVDGTARGQYSW